MRSGKKRVRKITKKMQIKLIAVFAFVLFLLVLLNIRIAYITTKSGDKYTKKVLSQQEYSSVTLPFKRGEIRDRNNNVLARSEKVYNVILDCYAVNSKEDYMEPTVNALIKGLGLDEEDVRGRLTSEETKDSQYQILAKKITLDEKKKFEELVSLKNSKELSDAQRKERENIQGVWFEEQYIRNYPMSALASNTIGFSNDLNDGICGLESYYTDILNGVDGREFGYLNSDSELQRTIVKPENGNTIISTLDVNIQQIIEKYLQEFEDEHSAGPDEDNLGRGSKNLGIIVANPKNGEILGMATNQSFDLNNPQDISKWYSQEDLEKMEEKKRSEALNSIWSNFCVSDAFEPGSTFKPVTISSALEMGALKGDELFYCDGHEFVTDTDINCDNIYGHGEETVSDAIKNSCNDALMQIAFKMKIDPFCKYQEELFHFGSRTGIDLPNENAGVLYPVEQVHEVELATYSFGQSFTSSMVQQMAAICAVVNGGNYYQPHMVKQILDENGGVVKNIEPVLLNQPVSARSSQYVLEAMEQGVLYGTGKKAQVPGYRVAGKTGTAEKQPREMGNYVVSFIGCAPVDDPQIVVYVVIDEPNVEDQSTGGYAQTISRKIMTEVLPYLNIYPTEEITDQTLMDLGITREDAEAGRVTERQTEEPETDEEGNVIPETDENGNPVQQEGGVASNPNMPKPPQETDSTEQSENGVTREDLGIE